VPEIQAYHNSYLSFYRKPFGAVTCGQKVRLKITVQSEAPVEKCLLRLWEKDEEKQIPMSRVLTPAASSRSEWLFAVEHVLPPEPGLVWYFFAFMVDGKLFYYGNNSENLGGEGELAAEQPPSYQITVYKEVRVPEWFKRGTMYQIFVDRFYNGNENGVICSPKPKGLIHADWYDTPFYIKDKAGRVVRWTFFGGNLRGVLAKLPYLEELGISILYLNPVFEAASSHKYDTGDYRKIDPMYGDDLTFSLLVKAAAKYGIAVILDGVFSHTGSDSVYFNKYGKYPGLGAFQSRESPYYAWYKFKETPGEYECWWCVEDLPNVNELEPSYQDFIFRREDSVIKTWMSKGVKGWRLDVADELPDQFIKGLRQAVKATDPQAVLIGEVWEDASRKISYGQLREYFWGDELDSVMNYPLRAILLAYMLGEKNAEEAVHTVMSLYENYPRENFLAAMNLIGSHDRARILTLLGEAPPEEDLPEQVKENFRLSQEARVFAVQRLKLLVLLQITFPGVPCVYYGDEAGAEGYSDPYNRGTFPWGREDREILTWYKRLLCLRREYDVWPDGDFLPFSVGEDVFGFRLTGTATELVVCVNRSSCREVEVDLAAAGSSQEERSDRVFLDLLAGTILETPQVTLQPLAGKVLLKAPKKTCQFRRSCGVLLPVTSLPSTWGIGDLGEDARKFVDFLSASGQSLWQVLPLNPPGEGNSPYQGTSVFAGNPLLISLESLLQAGLLTPTELREKVTGSDLDKQRATAADYAWAWSRKQPVLHKAFARFRSRLREGEDGEADEREGTYLTAAAYRSFLEKNAFWLDDFCLYTVLKEAFGNRPWYEWEKAVADREQKVLSSLREKYAEQLEYQRFLQYTFYVQWQNLKAYARAKGIKIIGDLPVYAAADSSDTWSHRHLFSLDDRGRPLAVGGVPPDYFSESGQLWGSPTYNWRVLQETGYAWWRQRIKQGMKMFDFIRLDHFRGFEAYWEVVAGQKSAVEGRWLKGPGQRFFQALAAELGNLPFLAEDLGFITPEVHNLKHLFGFPGMAVYQFAAPESEERPADLRSTAYYSGTHDNDTLLGWYSQNQGAGLNEEQNKAACRKIIAGLYQSEALWVILPLQDILLLGSEARMNTPGTTAGNWTWRLEAGALTPTLSAWLKSLAENSGRSGRQHS
jgi:4-alpha-glucanotransferase